MAVPGMKPTKPDRPEVTAGVGNSIRISWTIPDADPGVTASTLKVRIKGSQRLQNYDHGTHRLIPKGGSTVPAPTCSVEVNGVEEGLEYEAVLAVMNSEGWSEPSGFSEPGCIGTPKPRAKPPTPEPPKLSAVGAGKLRCQWVLPSCCPPVEATQVRITDVGTGKKMLVDAANGKLVESGRTTLAATRLEVNINGVQDCTEYTAAICCRNAEGFGEYSIESDSVANIDAKAQVGGMALVVSEVGNAEVPQMVPLGEGKMKVKWTLPDDAKSTTVKLRRVGDQNWYLCGGAPVPAPAAETVAESLAEGIEYEAMVSFLINNRWCCESEVSKPACIGELKLPQPPLAPKEPRLYVMDVGQGIIRVKWQYVTCVPPITGAIVRFRAVGAKLWLYANPATGGLEAESAEKEPDLIEFPKMDVDLRNLPLGIRFEAQVAFRNKLGTSPWSKESDIMHIGMLAARPLQCQYCQKDFDLQTAEYTKPCETFWCPPCRFKLMDPFNSVIEPYGILRQHVVMRPTIAFNLDLPDLKIWRKDEQSIWLRMVRMNSTNVVQVWPRKITMTANGAEVFQILPPEEGHVRRDVPKDISAGLRPGLNNVQITIEDEHVASFSWAIVRTQTKTSEQLAGEAPSIEEEESRRRVIALLTGRSLDDLKAEEKAAADAAMDEDGEKGEIIREEEKDRVLDEEKQGGDDDDLVTCVLSSKLKLRCPLSFERVETPVRGSSCMHLQCFGLDAYLESNAKMRAVNNRWTCPVCSNVLKPKDLRVDAYVQKILSETPSTVEEVDIREDGTYVVIDEVSGKEISKEDLLVLLAKEKEEAQRLEEAKQKNAEEGAEITAEQTTAIGIDDGEKNKRKNDSLPQAQLTKRQRRQQKRNADKGEIEAEDSD
eukprot:TRINITY_DN11301_c1_g1_i1.p1 TRINITY_DN11301_c1_g1~~TRINITY_DN11301_c1_g1_i1.p1  ORF type:complete len:923 (-),score=173.69 TRINITY_DN11301_c1_g1_i1:197-2848(-)